MNYKQAIEYTKLGFKIRLPEMRENTFITMKNGHLIIHYNDSSFEYSPYSQDLQSDQWEIFKNEN